MHLSILTLAALAPAVIADNTVTFMSMDATDRTVVWTGSGSGSIADTVVPAGQQVSVSVPTGWVGNAYSYSAGAVNKPGMLAEFAFNHWASVTFFDVSAIIDPNDHQGVYQMYPADTKTPLSGCQAFPCANAYYLPDDLQTKSTTSDHIIVTLGGAAVADGADTGSAVVDDAGASNSTMKRGAEAAVNHRRVALSDPHYRPAPLAARSKSALRWAARH